MKIRAAVWSWVLLAASTGTLLAGIIETMESMSATVLATGPRTGANGKTYFNIQGKKADKFASFGVLDFQVPKAGAQTLKVKAMTLTLVQSIARFAKDGSIAFYLTDESQAGSDPAAPLTFERSSADGLGAQFKTRYPLGKVPFKTVKTGHADRFTLLPDNAGRAALARRVSAGGPVRLLVVPGDDEVAATFFGSGESVAEDRRPRLTIELAP